MYSDIDTSLYVVPAKGGKYENQRKRWRREDTQGASLEDTVVNPRTWVS